MNDADACAGEHGDDLFGNFRKVDRDPVSLREPKFLERIRATIDLSVELAIGDDPFLVVLADPDDRHLILAPGFDVTVQTVIGNVAGGADEPLGPGIIPFENLGPGGEPLKLLGDVAPETFRVGNRFLVGAVVVLNIGRGFGLSGRLIHTAFLEEGIDVVCHGAMTPSGRGGKQIGAIMLEGQGGTQPYLGTGERKCRVTRRSFGCSETSVCRFLTVAQRRE